MQEPKLIIAPLFQELLIIKEGILFLKNLGTNVDSGTIVIDTTATVSVYSYNPSNGLFTCILNGIAGTQTSGIIYYDKYS